MVALKIDELKDFTRRLFVGEEFDSFLVREVDIVTFNSFSIDGKVKQGYYSEEELEQEKIERFSSWKKLKPFCFSLIKGSKLPERFFIVLQLSPDRVEQFLQSHNLHYSTDQVSGLYLNIKYEEHILTCVSGTSFNQFTLDKALEREWDEEVRQFLKRLGMGFEEQ